METPIIQNCPRTKLEFGQLYLGNQKVSRDYVHRWLQTEIDHNPKLKSELSPLGWSKNTKLLSCSMQQVLFKHLGFPFLSPQQQVSI